MPLLRETASRRPPARAGEPPARPGRSWRRPYPPGPFRVGLAAVLLLLVTFLLAAAGLDALVGAGGPVLRLLVAAAVTAAVALRMLRIGLWVSRDGLRAVTLLRTCTVAWDRVESVRTAQQPVRWLSLPRRVQGQALVVRYGGGRVLPELVTDRGPDFLGRADRFEAAASAIAGWARAR